MDGIRIERDLDILINPLPMAKYYGWSISFKVRDSKLYI